MKKGQSRNYACPVPGSAPSVSASLRHDGRGLDVVELRELLRQVRIAAGRNLALTRLLAVLRSDLLDDVHALRDLAEWGKTLLVEERVVLEVDEHLRAARVRCPGPRERDVPTLVRLLGRLVFHGRRGPRLRD